MPQDPHDLCRERGPNLVKKILRLPNNKIFQFTFFHRLLVKAFRRFCVCVFWNEKIMLFFFRIFGPGVFDFDIRLKLCLMLL